MKKIITLLNLFILLAVCINTKAQNVPQGINYQAIAQDNLGAAIINTGIGIKISIYSVSPTGTLQWQETHTQTTNQFGLFTLVIGQGISTGNGAALTFSAINWGGASHYLKVSLDVTGGSNYVDMDNSHLISVPYSLYSQKAGSLLNPISINNLTDVDTAGTAIGKTLKWNGTNWVPAIDSNNDTALFAYTANFANTVDTAMYAINSAPCDTALFAYNSDSSNYSNTANTANTANYSTYSDTATYALNCIGATATDWHLAGNTGITTPTNFIGTTNAADLIIKTNNLERMRITSSGKIGIGTTTPTASLHIVGNSGLISQGTFGSGKSLNPGAGSMMMWNPRRAAFRVGYSASNTWDSVYVGNYSFASGYDTKASKIGTVAMGQSSYATDSCAVAIGYNAAATGAYSVSIGNTSTAGGYCAVALGRGPNASGNSAVAIGYHVDAAGNYSTAFGYYSSASGNNSVAMGYRASTNNKSGSFIFADNSSNNVVTNNTANNQFMVKASGGSVFYSKADLSTGVVLPGNGGGAWASLSDKRKKENFKDVDGNIVLNKIREMEITSWNYKSQSKSIRHIGPMAQDFYAAFKIGESDTTITTTDIDGINMIAIEALAKKTAELNVKANEVASLKSQVEKLEADKRKLEKRIVSIEKQLDSQSELKSVTSSVKE